MQACIQKSGMHRVLRHLSKPSGKLHFCERFMRTQVQFTDPAKTLARIQVRLRSS